MNELVKCSSIALVKITDYFSRYRNTSSVPITDYDCPFKSLLSGIS